VSPRSPHVKLLEVFNEWYCTFSKTNYVWINLPET
jgi:hypothetical protein